MNAQIIVIGGTKDSRSLIEELIKYEIKVTATVVTEFASSLLPNHEALRAVTGKLALEDLICLINETKPLCLIDASHPYAVEVSENAAAACSKTGTCYLRMERQKAEYAQANIIRVKTFEEAAKKAADFNGNIFLTTGSKNLKIFTNAIKDYKDRLYIRVLPDSSVIAACEKTGLTAENIAAVKGPFSEEMNIEMLRHFKADLLVTKDSGREGGTMEKINAANKLNIPVILIERPRAAYPFKVSTADEAIEFIRDLQIKGVR